MADEPTVMVQLKAPRTVVIKWNELLPLVCEKLDIDPGVMSAFTAQMSGDVQHDFKTFTLHIEGFTAKEQRNG